MSVRAWFRLLRGSMWDREGTFAADIDRIATGAIAGDLPREWLRCGPTYWIESVESYKEHERVLTLVRADMERALHRLVYTKDLTA